MHLGHLGGADTSMYVRRRMHEYQMRRRIHEPAAFGGCRHEHVCAP
jgi:hypothetical protein